MMEQLEEKKFSDEQMCIRLQKDPWYKKAIYWSKEA